MHYVYCNALRLLHCITFTVRHYVYCMALRLLHGITFTALHYVYCMALRLLHGNTFTALHYVYCIALRLPPCSIYQPYEIFCTSDYTAVTINNLLSRCHTSLVVVDVGGRGDGP
jgi:hypothetical protein